MLMVSNFQIALKNLMTTIEITSIITCFLHYAKQCIQMLMFPRLGQLGLELQKACENTFISKEYHDNRKLFLRKVLQNKSALFGLLVFCFAVVGLISLVVLDDNMTHEDGQLLATEKEKAKVSVSCISFKLYEFSFPEMATALARVYAILNKSTSILLPIFY